MSNRDLKATCKMICLNHRKLHLNLLCFTKQLVFGTFSPYLVNHTQVLRATHNKNVNIQYLMNISTSEKPLWSGTNLLTFCGSAYPVSSKRKLYIPVSIVVQHKSKQKKSIMGYRNLQPYHLLHPWQQHNVLLLFWYHAEKDDDHLEEEGSNHSLHISNTPALSILHQLTCHPRCPLGRWNIQALVPETASLVILVCVCRTLYTYVDLHSMDCLMSE